jgi:large subunit ribosomal protein L15
MTSKKRRQRGSNTHGGGTHKNRRGAGNRGGRGNAGSQKHEMHNYGSWEKHGFNRPDDVQETVTTVDVQTLDEDAPLYAADGVAEELDDGYRIDARDVVKDGHEVDRVKVLGGGQVRGRLEIVADSFSATAVELLEDAGGEAIVSERGQADDEPEESTETEPEE